ncbi:MAG: S24/S26 family peptidase [Pseudomonadota bacterium]
MGLLGFVIARVRGASMEPGLPDGSFALFRRRKAVKRGDVILVDHPEFGLIVKRVHVVSRSGLFHLEGTGKLSTDRSRLGGVERDRIKGKLLFKIL